MKTEYVDYPYRVEVNHGFAPDCFFYAPSKGDAESFIARLHGINPIERAIYGPAHKQSSTNRVVVKYISPQNLADIPVTLSDNLNDVPYDGADVSFAFRRKSKDYGDMEDADYLDHAKFLASFGYYIRAIHHHCSNGRDYYLFLCSSGGGKEPIGLDLLQSKVTDELSAVPLEVA